MTYAEKMNNLTETGNKLKNMLYKFRDDDEFVYHILRDAEGDINKQKLIDYIESGRIKNGDGTIIASYDMKKNIKPIRCSVEELQNSV